MRTPSSMPRTKIKNERQENSKHARRVAKMFIEYCCWKSLAPLALSDRKPPVPVKLKLVRELYPKGTKQEDAVIDLYEVKICVYMFKSNATDIFALMSGDGKVQTNMQDEPVVWDPKGETRQHVRLGECTAMQVKGLNKRVATIESSERTWVRSIHEVKNCVFITHTRLTLSRA